MSLPRPPADISPDDFFRQWLPARFAELRAVRPDEPLPDASLGVTLTGDGGGAWTLALAGNQLSVSSEPGQRADLQLEQSVRDWRAILAQDTGVPAEGLDKLLANQTALQTLRDLSGTIELQINGFEGGTWSLRASFSGAAQPHATISIDAETINAIRNGTLPAPQAFFAGKIVMTGDTAFAMQVGMAMMSAMA